MSSNNENIKLYCRIRSEKREIPNKVIVTSSVIKFSQNNEDNEFLFDKVFNYDSNQNDIFEITAKPLVLALLEGYNSNLICMGLPNSGKTFTFRGINTENDKKGLIYKAVEYLFQLINNSSEDLEFSVKCSFFEIVNEKVKDLLDPRKTNLLIKEENEKGIWIQDLSEVYLSSPEEFCDLFKQATTNQNEIIRTDFIFSLMIFQRNTKNHSTKTGKICFVDLSGTSKIKSKPKSENTKGMTSLVNSIINYNDNKHLNNTDSKLNKILNNAIGGNSFTAIVNHAYINTSNFKENTNFMKQIVKARNIKNKPIINSETSYKEVYMKLIQANEKIKTFEKIINDLNNQIDQSKQKSSQIISTISTDQSSFRDNKKIEESVTSRCEDCAQAMGKILNQHIEIVTLVEDLEKIKKEKKELEEEIRIRNDEIFELNEKILTNEQNMKSIFQEELKNLKILQNKLEGVFIMNNQKFISVGNFKNSLLKISEEIIQFKEFHSKNNNEVGKITSLEDSIENLFNYLEELEKAVHLENQILSEGMEFFKDKSNLNTESYVKTEESLNRSYDELEKSVTQKSVRIEKLSKSKSHSYLKPKSNHFESVKNKGELTSREGNKRDYKLRTRGSMNLDFTKLSEFQEYDLISSQRKTMVNMTEQIKLVRETLDQQRKENKEKEKIINLNNEKLQNLADAYEKKLKKLDIEYNRKNQEFMEYKERTIKDFSYKENQILELHNKVCELEDERFRLLHLDKDKKKFYAMELQVKQLTNEMQKLCKDNIRFKNQFEKNQEELKIEIEKNKILESKIQHLNINKNTPEIPNQISNNGKTFNFTLLNEIVQSSINNGEKHSANKDKDKSIHTNNNKIMKIVKSKGGQLQMVQTSNLNVSNNSGNNIKNPVETLNINSEFDNRNYLLSKTPKVNNKLQFFVNKNENKAGEQNLKKDRDQFKKEKIEQEMKILDEDFIEEASQDVSKIRQNVQSNKNYRKNDKEGGILSIFSKLLENK